MNSKTEFKNVTTKKEFIRIMANRHGITLTEAEFIHGDKWPGIKNNINLFGQYHKAPKEIRGDGIGNNVDLHRILVALGYYPMNANCYRLAIQPD